MSIEAMSWALSLRHVGQARWHLLLVLANRADPEGFAYPSRRYLAERTDLAPSTITRLLRELEQAGLLRKEERFSDSGRQTSSLYQLALGGDFSEQGGEPHPPRSQGVGGVLAASSRGVLAASSHETKEEDTKEEEHIREPSSRQSASESEGADDALFPAAAPVAPARQQQARKYPEKFEEFWKLYPAHRRREKPKAYQEWRAAVRRVEPAKIMRGLRLYVRGDVQFAPYPAKWLKNDSWDDLPISGEATVSVPDRRIVDILNEDAREFAAREGEDHW